MANNIVTELLKEKIANRIEEQITLFQDKKDQVEELHSEIKFFVMMSLALLHICLRPYCHPFERIVAVLVAWTIAKAISKKFFEAKMEHILRRWDDFHNLMNYIYPTLEKDDITEFEVKNIEDDIKNVTHTKRYPFVMSNLFDLVINVLFLGIALIIFLSLNYSFLNGVYCTLLAFLLSKTVVTIKEMATL